MEPTYHGRGLTTCGSFHRMDLSSNELPLFPSSGGPEDALGVAAEAVPTITEEIPSLAFATHSQAQTSVDGHQSEEDDDIAFAAEAAANAVEEADAEQQRLDQSLMTCRVCGQGGVEGRPLLHFLPMDPAIVLITSQALPPSSPIPTTFSDHICLHIFCGKTASILPSVCRPELEILAKVGLKNKHGIGAEVNAALARTRTATFLSMQENTDALANKHDKQFYLAKEFEAHLAAIRICAATILDGPDTSKLDFDVLSIPPPPAQVSPKKVTRKRKRAHSSTTSSHCRPLLSLTSEETNDLSRSAPLQGQVTMPQQTGPMVNTTSTNSTLQLQAMDMQRLQQHMHSRIATTQNGVTVPINNERTNSHSSAVIAQPEMLLRPPSLMPQIFAHPGNFLHQQSSLLVFSDQSMLQHPSNSPGISSGLEGMQERLPPMRAVTFPPQVPSNSTKKKSRSFWNRRPICPAKVGSSDEIDPSITSPKHPGASPPEVKCDCGGTFHVEDDANGVLGWQSHVATTQHQRWMADCRNGTGNQNCYK